MGTLTVVYNALAGTVEITSLKKQHTVITQSSKSITLETDKVSASLVDILFLGFTISYF